MFIPKGGRAAGFAHELAIKMLIYTQAGLTFPRGRGSLLTQYGS